jgi:low temperature requirement protein LtrA
VPDPYVEREHRVSPLELFFDLVFVFAFTQRPTDVAHRLARGDRIREGRMI